MRVRRTAPFILVALAVIAVWTAVSWRQARPYPALFAWLLDNPLSARLLGTQTTLDQIGLRPGQRVREIGAGISQQPGVGMSTPTNMNDPISRRTGR